MEKNKDNEINLIKKKITLFSLLVSIILVLFKIIIAYLSNSIGVFSEALNNGLDLVTVLITFFAIRLASRPADKDHTYGHGKYENLSAFIELVIIFLLSSFIIYKSIVRIISGSFNLSLNIYIFLALAISILINIVRVYLIGKIVRKFNSFALKAEFLNYLSDIFSSIVVISGLLLARSGFAVADPIASIIIAVIVLILSTRLTIKVVKNLLDYIPGEVTEKISNLLLNNSEIKSINKIKAHEVGDIKFINLDISLEKNLYLSQVEKIKRNLKEDIKLAIPEAETIIEVNTDFSEENISSMVKKILFDFREIQDVHNIFVYKVKDGVDISIHVGTSKNLNLAHVEKLTKAAEESIKKEIKKVRSIYIHVEDLRSHESWDDITHESDNLINDVKKAISGLIKPETCHNFTILKKDTAYNIAFHCRMDKKINIKKAHLIISEVENLIKSKFSNIGEVMIHVEPEQKI